MNNDEILKEVLDNMFTKEFLRNHDATSEITIQGIKSAVIHAISLTKQKYDDLEQRYIAEIGKLQERLRRKDAEFLNLVSFKDVEILKLFDKAQGEKNYHFADQLWHSHITLEYLKQKIQELGGRK